MPTLKEILQKTEREYILSVLIASKWQFDEAASILKICRKCLWEKRRKYELHPPTRATTQQLEIPA